MGRGRGRFEDVTRKDEVSTIVRQEKGTSLLRISPRTRSIRMTDFVRRRFIYKQKSEITVRKV